MLLSILKLLQGYLQVTLTGSAPERFLNFCVRRDILIWNLSPNKTAGGYDFCISRRGFHAAEDLLQRTRTTMTIRKKCGVPFFLHRYRARKLFLIGIFLCLLLLWNCSKYVWKIEINGTNELSEDMILTWLSKQERTYGTRKSRIDCASLERALRNDFETVAWTSVKLEGTKLTVDIQESLSDTDTSTLPESGEWDIVATEDARVSSIFTRRGTPLVEKGMLVSKGAILISGRLDIIDDNGEIAEQHYVVSDGDVTGIVTRDYEAALPRDYQKKVYTGEEHTSYLLQIGSTQIPIGKKAAFDVCETLVSDRQLEILPGFYLPVHLFTTTQHAYVYRPETYTKEEVEAHAQAGWELFLEKFTQKGIPIIVKNVKIETNEKNCMIRGTIEADIPLGSYAPTQRVEVPSSEGHDHMQ